jgi:hypothetical protein
MSQIPASLPPYFPLVRKGCEDVAEGLFKCLGENADQSGSSASASRSIESCSEVLASYSTCTKHSLGAKGAKQPIVLTEWEKESKQ